MRYSRHWVIVFIIMACFASRLPILLDPELILDGDECVVAMMAKHLYQGKTIPLFFYGQNYGFSVLEVVAILLFYVCMGISVYAVKLGMLSLWTVGTVFFYLTLKQLSENSKWLPLSVTLILILAPGWAAFSMKPLGGYITAYTLSSIVLFLFFHAKYASSISAYILAGILLGIIFQAQMLWLPGLFPFLALQIWRRRKSSSALALVVPFILVSCLFYAYKEGLSMHQISARFNPKDVLLPYLARIPRYVYCAMHGTYGLWIQGRPSQFISLYSGLATAMVLLLPAASFLAAFKREKYRWLLVASGCSVLCTLLQTLFTYHIQGRYLLPLIATLFLGLFILINAYPTNKRMIAFVIGLLTISSLAFGTFKTFYFPYTSPKSLQQAITHLKEKKIEHVYCTHGMLTWQIVFYSDEQIVARPYKFPGRYASYAIQVDGALNRGMATAVVGYRDTTLNEYEYLKGRVIGDIFIEVNPKRERLSKRFEFKEGELYPQYQ